MSYGDKYWSQYVPEESLVKFVQKRAELAGERKVVDIPKVLATEESLEGYGELLKGGRFDHTHVSILQWPSPGNRAVRGGVGGGVVEGKLVASWDGDKCNVKNEDVNDNYLAGWKHKDDIYVQDATYHPDSSQVFAAEKLDSPEPYILILSKHHRDEDVLPIDFVAFYVFTNQTIRLHPYIWHVAVFPLKSTANLRTKQGKVHPSVFTDFFREYGVYLRIKDAFSVKKDSLPSTVPDLSIKGDPRLSSTPSEVPAIFRRGSVIVTTTGLPIEKQSLTKATEQNISDFGRLVPRTSEPTLEVLQWPRRSGREVYLGKEGGIGRHNFSVDWDDRHRDTQEMIIVENGKCCPSGVAHCNNSETFLIDIIWSRIDGESLLMAREPASYGLALSLSDGKGEVKGETLGVFLIPEDKAVVLKPGVWRSSPFISAKELSQVLFQERYSAVDAQMELRFSDENVKHPIKVDGKPLLPSS